MPVSARIIKRKIKSVKNTKKITKAMEMIAAVKMRKAVLKANSARKYSQLIADIIANIAKSGTKITHPLFEENESNKELIMIIGSNRGLCGSYNSNVAIALRNYLQHRMESDSNFQVADLSAIAINKKAGKIVNTFEIELGQYYDELPEEVVISDVSPVITSIIEGYLRGDYKSVHILYTEFLSSLSQKPKLAQVLPINSKLTGATDPDTGALDETNEEGVRIEYKFEPTVESVLDNTIKKYVEMQIYQAFLDSNASEHSSRMVAMKNATDSATDMIGELTLEFNKSRQAAITQEIAEISNAAAAVK